MSDWSHGAVQARWIGALWVRTPRGSFLIDAPAGIARALAEADGLHDLRTVIVSTNRLRSVEGLPGLCEAIARARGKDAVLHVVHGLDCPRVAAIADAWTRGWPDSTGIALDGVRSADPIELAGDAEVTLTSLTAAEPGPGGGVVPVSGAAVRVSVGGVDIVWVPAARPNAAHARASVGAALAVLEIGRAPWPKVEQPWRPTLPQALAVSQHADAVWIVGDDGARVDTESDES